MFSPFFIIAMIGIFTGASAELVAAQWASSFLEKALGIKLSVLSEKDASGKGIYIGHTELAKKAGIVGKEKEF